LKKQLFLIWSLLFLSLQIVWGQKNSGLEIVFEHYFGNQPLRFDQAYITESGDTIYLNKLQYYVSNFQIQNHEGKDWQEKNSYRLLKISDEQNQFKLLLNPSLSGTYQKIKFSLGIDSLRNHQGAQTGDLDPIEGMFWTWEQGYIFFKCEGYYFHQSGQRRGLVYHLGREECYRELEFAIDSTTKRLHIKVDLKKLFGGFAASPLTLTLLAGKSATNIMGGSKAPQLANNWVKMFEIMGK
jgi:hypothetical protein